jgi:hypothetical protein
VLSRRLTDDAEATSIVEWSVIGCGMKTSGREILIIAGRSDVDGVGNRPLLPGIWQ